MPRMAPYGTWLSPITAASVAAGGIDLREPRIVDRDVYWLEGRPSEGGRVTLVRRGAAGGDEMTPAPLDVRTRAHEYGGGAWAVHGATVFFSNLADQRLYRRDAGGACRPITPTPREPAGDRFADVVPVPGGRALVCIRERLAASARDAVSEIVAVPADGAGSPVPIVSGRDFFASPRISPDARRLAWLAWDHPCMPWDGCELWLADLARDGSIGSPRCVAGGPDESIFQPEWSPGGVLHWISDRTGWWNLYRLRGAGAEALAPIDAEVGVPQWTFGMSRYAFLADGRIACVYTRGGFDRLAMLRPGGALEPADLPYTAFDATVRSSGGTVVFIASTVAEPRALVRLDALSGRCEVVRRSVEHGVDASVLSRPEAITFPGAAGRAVHALYYAPANAAYAGDPGERPPLLVQIHGGPTAQARAECALETQFWTSRGFAVVDVNYSGSSGYGRPYRERLRGNWGIVDAEDCVHAARHLVREGRADPRRTAIRGGSAGGYTALCALVFHDDFAAGASYYGIADCETLAASTHKFEAHYLDRLIGPYPAAQEIYRRRSPVHHADRLACPVVIFQGLEDRVVPPSQAEALVAALRAKGLPFGYLAFEGEHHGFRRAETIRRALEAELYFYSRVFELTLTERLEPIAIENLQARRGAAPRQESDERPT